MGGTTFECVAEGQVAAEAFRAAVEQAQYDHGHAGYSGTIAEKHSYVMITHQRQALEDAEELARKLIEGDDPRISDKWGDAGCIPVENGRYLFFGWASC